MAPWFACRGPECWEDLGAGWGMASMHWGLQKSSLKGAGNECPEECMGPAGVYQSSALL